ncbi:MAG: hypothetical protein ACRYF5_12075, partial [Janthinobacterium lividum]
QHANPFLAAGADFDLYAQLQKALEEHIQFELASGSTQFFQGLLHNTNVLGLNHAQQHALAQRAQANPVVPRRGASPRTNFMARSVQSGSPASPPRRHDPAWVAAFLVWIESERFPPGMQDGFRQVLEENRNNPDVRAIQSACVVPIHSYAHDKKGRDPKLDELLIQLIRKLRNQTFEFQGVTPGGEQ